VNLEELAVHVPWFFSFSVSLVYGASMMVNECGSSDVTAVHYGLSERRMIENQARPSMSPPKMEASASSSMRISSSRDMAVAGREWCGSEEEG
jgi:hypothetical protein